MGTVCQGNVIVKALSIKHTREHLTLCAISSTLATGLHHTITCQHLVILHTHFQEIIQKMVEGISSTISLHATLVVITHLSNHVSYQSQRETRNDILPITKLFFRKGKPKRQSHGKDTMTDVSHGSEPADIEGNAQPLYLLDRHGNATHHVMLEETRLDLIRVRRRKLITT